MGHPSGDAQSIRIWVKAVNSGGWNLDLQTPRLRPGSLPRRPASGSLGFLSQCLWLPHTLDCEPKMGLLFPCGLNRRWLLTTSSSEK